MLSPPPAPRASAGPGRPSPGPCPPVRGPIRNLTYGLLGVALAAGCGAKGDLTALDCYAELPDDVSDKLSRQYIATPTRPGPVIEGEAVVEQLQVGLVGGGDTDELFSDVDEDWVGIAYDPAQANPSNPEAEWNPDHVFDVVFTDRLPAAFSAWADHFEPDDGRLIYAEVGWAGLGITPTELRLVIADDGCSRLVPAANGELEIDLLPAAAGG